MIPSKRILRHSLANLCLVPVTNCDSELRIDLRTQTVNHVRDTDALHGSRLSGSSDNQLSYSKYETETISSLPTLTLFPPELEEF
ncbi:hypothetical protein RRG08_003691 [Elysia crispata]|uniref:Uncharacterized protein n=1 Tax=Elysia crispata TaxID=231223 RepID=A0AAE1AWA7_9GAST|nr:hypothetical protein RRG08_003691 [Elysia crispata]